MHDDYSPDHLDLCPQLRYARCLLDDRLREYAQARGPEEQQAAVAHAIDLARIITNLIEPMARDCCLPGFVTEYHHLAERLFDLARPWAKHHPTDFPEPRDQSLLILDRLEQLEHRIVALFSRPTGSQQRRAA